jgi:uncharacterized protein YbjT (DUF2867 family)
VITGPESLTQAGRVAIVGQALGRSLRFEEQPAYVTATVETVTGAPARTFREWASDHADLFRGPAGASR